MILCKATSANTIASTPATASLCNNHATPLAIVHPAACCRHVAHGNVPSEESSSYFVEATPRPDGEEDDGRKGRVGHATRTTHRRARHRISKRIARRDRHQARDDGEREPSAAISPPASEFIRHPSPDDAPERAYDAADKPGHQHHPIRTRMPITGHRGPETTHRARADGREHEQNREQRDRRAEHRHDVAAHQTDPLPDRFGGNDVHIRDKKDRGRAGQDGEREDAPATPREK